MNKYLIVKLPTLNEQIFDSKIWRKEKSIHKKEKDDNESKKNEKNNFSYSNNCSMSSSNKSFSSYNKKLHISLNKKPLDLINKVNLITKSCIFLSTKNH